MRKEEGKERRGQKAPEPPGQSERLLLEAKLRSGLAESRSRVPIGHSSPVHSRWCCHLDDSQGNDTALQSIRWNHTLRLSCIDNIDFLHWFSSSVWQSKDDSHPEVCRRKTTAGTLAKSDSLSFVCCCGQISWSKLLHSGHKTSTPSKSEQSASSGSRLGFEIAQWKTSLWGLCWQGEPQIGIFQIGGSLVTFSWTWYRAWPSWARFCQQRNTATRRDSTARSWGTRSTGSIPSTSGPTCLPRSGSSNLRLVSQHSHLTWFGNETRQLLVIWFAQGHWSHVLSSRRFRVQFEGSHNESLGPWRILVRAGESKAENPRVRDFLTRNVLPNKKERVSICHENACLCEKSLDSTTEKALWNVHSGSFDCICTTPESQVASV